MTQQTKRQICNLLQCHKSAVKVNVLSVLQQANGVHCGLFTVVFIQNVLCFNENQVAVKFNQAQVQRHALDPVQHNKLDLFPTLPDSAQVKICRQKDFKLEIFCSCRMIWAPSNRRCIV